MHGHSPESVLLVNAEVDSMGGVIDGGVGIDSKTSPRQAAIEKAQAELRQEYDVREERRRELEFLEKGGNPLDFKLGPATSISVQSTSLTDQFVTSEAKGSFALTASPRGDSVESSGRPGAPPSRETNSADNLLLFDGENDILEGERNSNHGRSNVVLSEQFSQSDGCHNAKESEDSVMFRFVVKGQAYRRRNRSRSSRDSARVSSTELAPVGDGNGSSILSSSRHISRDVKGSLCEANTAKDRTVSSICNSKSTSPNGNVDSKTLASGNQLDRELDVPQAHVTASGLTKLVRSEVESVVTASKDLLGCERNQHPQVDSGQVPNTTTFVAPELVGEGEEAVPQTENLGSVGQPNGFSDANIDGRDMPKSQNGTAFSKKGLDLESSCTQISQRLDGNTSNDQFPCSRKLNSHGISKKQTSVTEDTPDISIVNLVKENSETKAVEVHDNHASICLNPRNSGSCVKTEEEICNSRSGLENEVKPLVNSEAMEHNGHIFSKTELELDNQSDNNSTVKRVGLCPQGQPSSTKISSNCEFPVANFSGRGSTIAPELQTCTGSHLKLTNKAHEDSILEEARSIEAKRKRIAELSVGSFPSENRRKSHWDFVLEEMAWLANDFMQEHVWKITAAAQISQLAAFNGRLRFDKQNLCQKQKKIAHTLAKAIMQFWRSAEVLINSDDPGIDFKDGKLASVESQKVNEGEAVDDRIGEANMDTSKCLKEQNSKKSQLAVQGYAVRFLEYSRSLDCPVQAEAPVTPDRIFDSGIVEISWEDRFSEETLFYTVPPGAMEDYRKSVEIYWSQYEKTGSNMHQEEVETSIFDAVAEFGSRENMYEEDEREMGAYYLPGAFEGSKPSNFAQKKRKNLPKSYTARSYDVGADLPYGQFMENKLEAQPSSLMGKRPSNCLNVSSIPTKRLRTATRQRVLSPFSAGATGGIQMPSTTDVSSGDTSSFQGDQSTVHGGSQIRKILEVESTGEFGKQLTYDYTEVSTKPKKKKKAKHLAYKNSLNSTDTVGFVIGKGSVYEHRWQLDSMVQNEQRDHSKRRLQSHAFETNGNSGVLGQHAAKKPKIMKQLRDTSPESITPVVGSIPSPAASQMSNMSNPNKFIKLIAGRDRGRKTKALKMPAVQSGSGSPWSQFEDQALVVLVHDMGPNWELVSDAINSTLQFKCIFRKPKECKERHKVLMDRNSGDGADSAEDSGSSQPYPSTLPGIPKGSARQLFQRLQGPMEEDTLKSHFEKIILIGQKQHSRRTQNDNQEAKHIAAPVHNSHVVALSQVCPNNLNGATLTPRDFCDAITSSSDVHSLGYQGPHTGGLAISNQGSVAPVLSTSGVNSMLQGSSGMVIGSNLPSPSAALSVSSRDAQRHGVPRSPSLHIDEQQKVQQYNHMLSGRNIRHSNLSASGSSPTDRGVRMLPGGSGMGMMSGMNRVMSMPRPGFQGIGSPAMLNMVSSGSMLPSSGVGMPSPVNMHNGTVSGQGNSMIRTREALHMMRPVQNPEDQRQMMMQELQLQVTQGNSQGIPPFNGVSTGFSNQTVPPPVQTFPVQHQQQHQMTPQHTHVLGNPHHPHIQGGNHATTSQQQAYMLRLAKERQLQQRFLHNHHHHQFPASNTSMPHVQTQSQHPISSAIQNSSQIPQQASSQPVSLPSPNSQHPLTSSSPPMNPISSQPQQKQHHLPPHGLGRNPQAVGGSLPNQMLKQRQRQQLLQQPGRHHPQQRQQPQPQPQSQSQQQAKLVKGIGRGNTIMHQNLPIESSHLNGLSTTPGNQVAEKGEQAVHLMQSQGLFSGSGSSPLQTGKALVPPQSSNQCAPQQKLFSRSPPPSSKQLSQMPSHPDSSNQGQVPPDSSGHTVLASQQPALPLAAMASSQQQSQSLPQQRQVGQSQPTVQRILQQNRQVNSEPSMQSSVDHGQLNQQPVNNTFQMAMSATLPQSCTESTNVMSVVSPASAPSQWKGTEPLYDSSSSIGNPTLPTPARLEPLPSQVLTQRQFSGSMSMHGHNVGTQWQPQQPPPQQPLPPTQQQPQQQPQPQSQHLQSGQAGLYARPTNSGPG